MFLEGDLLPCLRPHMSTSATRVVDFAVNNGFVSGRSAAIRSLNATLPDIACTDVPVLLTGESGTGKEVYGRLIHRLSKHSQTPMNKLSCRTLDASELLGYIKALQNESSGNGQNGTRTLFLDGIDEANLECQKILISLLPDGEGSENAKHIRLIASATRNLDRDSEEGRFRRELYFRISGVCVQLPPLRERAEDLPELLEHFLAKYAAELGRELPVVSDSELHFLQQHSWPGNVRELENVARKMVILGDSAKAIQDLRGEPKPERSQDGQATSSLKVAARAASRQAERDLISKALERTHWNRKRAARDLQISYKSLLYKIKQIGLDGTSKGNIVKEGQ